MKFAESMEEVANKEGIDINCKDRCGSEVPFCCVQVVPCNLEVDECKLKADDLEITFTPKLRFCVDEEVITCNVNGAECQVEAEVLRLVGCIQYAISTLNSSVFVLLFVFNFCLADSNCIVPWLFPNFITPPM